MGFLNRAKNFATAAKTKWNATANARARMAAQAANIAARTGAAAQGYATQIKNRFKGPGVQPVVKANQAVASAASQAVRANNAVAVNPTSATAVNQAIRANKKLNTAVTNAVAANKVIAKI